MNECAERNDNIEGIPDSDNDSVGIERNRIREPVWMVALNDPSPIVSYCLTNRAKKVQRHRSDQIHFRAGGNIGDQLKVLPKEGVA